MLMDHVVCAWVRKEFPDMRQKERRIEFTPGPLSGPLAGGVLENWSEQQTLYPQTPRVFRSAPYPPPQPSPVK